MLFLFLIPLWGPCPWPLCLLLPSLQTYARFTGAPLKVHKITNPWRSPSGTQCPWVAVGAVRKGMYKGKSRRQTGMWCNNIWISS